MSTTTSSSSSSSISPQPQKPLSPSSVFLSISDNDLKGTNKTLTLTKMLKLNAIVGGIEFCGSAAFCFIPPMLLKAGIDEQLMSMILGVGPLMSLFCVPLIGRWSDSCKSPYGRRRPYIFILSIILLLAMSTLLSAHYIGRVVMGGGDFGRFTTTLLLILGCAFLDFTYQICLTPCEALLSDLSHGTDQQQSCFTVYSFMISFGGCIGYLITALDWSDLGLYFGSQENCVFIILILMYTISMIITLHTAKEKAFVEPLSNASHRPDAILHSDEMIKDSPSDDIQLNMGWNVRIKSAPFLLIRALYHITSIKNFLCMHLYAVSPDVLLQFFSIPHTLKQLALANLFSWTAINTFNLFYTDYIGRIIYHGSPHDEEGSLGRALYDEGVRMASWGLFFHCIVSSLYAPLINHIIKHLTLQATYFCGMATFLVSMGLMVFSPGIFLTNLCASATGLGYATITTVPYLLLSSYHDHLEVTVVIVFFLLLLLFILVLLFLFVAFLLFGIVLCSFC